jgi:MoaA/NifB/PqqE/SkfB family radical SAM enzyme
MGNSRDVKLANGFMEAETLARIVDKAKSECDVHGIALFNWTEPTLHPNLPELIRVVQDRGVSCYISSNLNTLRDVDGLMAANPYSFRISASGFTQDVYGYSHRGGDIERVKKHMVQLVEAKRRMKATTRIHVLYHRYKNNLADEVLMKEFAANLGIGFEPVWAFMMPLEKTLAYVNGNPSEGGITGKDLELIDKLALPLNEAFAATKRLRYKPCSLLENQIALDFRGDVQLCCAVFDPSRFTVANFLKTSLDRIQEAKKGHDMCRGCASVGGHIYVTGGAPEFDEIAARNVSPQDAEALGLQSERVRKRVRRWFENSYRRLFSRIVSPEQSAKLGDLFDRMTK